ncbi:MAG UNVERIFIED_CONTAM: serine/threonine protein kinase [Planctomycetaceae bacterium]|jgi:serine/threonine-protein kinase
MTDEKESASSLSLSASALVPLSERPLVGDDQKTVISLPESSRQESRIDSGPFIDGLRQRLFPANGAATGEESGVRIAHYEIHQRLGAGGMGAVFRATDMELARDVALKIMHPGPSADSSLVARFRNEACGLPRLNHDNIARVFFAGVQDGLYFIAYEFAGGRTLRDLIVERGRLSAAETVNLAIQITLVLNHIAGAGIVHRDIKPSNIMVTESGRVKRWTLGWRRESEDSIGEITAAGTTLGTFDYIAPEQVRILETLTSAATFIRWDAPCITC